MDKDPVQIRREIDETRSRMASTVEAVEYRADVPARMKDRAAEAADNAKAMVKERMEDARDAARTLTPTANPLGLAFGTFAAGALLGFLLPHTDIEDERIGEVADQAKEQIQETGKELIERGKSVARDAAQAVVDTTAESMSAGNPGPT
jgi:hypothetical protein